jgi:hypothetical protein
MAVTETIFTKLALARQLFITFTRYVITNDRNSLTQQPYNLM